MKDLIINTDTGQVTEVDEIPHCSVCGFFDCICEVRKTHQETCKFRRAITCPVDIECDHGRSVCPICDPCTCGES